MHIEYILEVRDRNNDSEPFKVSLLKSVYDIFKGFEISVTHSKYNLESLNFCFFNCNYTICFRLSQLPYNCGVIVLGFVEIHTKKDIWNRLEILSEAIPKILELCALMGYTKVITTTNSKNKLDEFVSNGFTESKDLKFVNRRTANMIYTTVYEIEYDAVAEEEDEDEHVEW